MSYKNKKFLFLVSDQMSDYTLQDISGFPNVFIINKCHITENRYINKIYRLHTAVGLNKRINVPLKTIWYNFLLKPILINSSPDYIVFSSPWYEDGLIKYIKKYAPNCRIILKCGDKVSMSVKNSIRLSVEKMREKLDGVIVYNPLDAQNYGFLHHDMGYSRIDTSSIKKFPQCDVAFIGAAKDRLEDIRYAYSLFRNAGLSCYFYVTGVPKDERKDDGILYADKNLSFLDYIARELSAKCLFELVQKGSTGRTYRMMEAIIYDKLLITNCTESYELESYNARYIQNFMNVSEIDADFVKKFSGKVDFRYNGEFSPIRLLEFIDERFS